MRKNTSGKNKDGRWPTTESNLTRRDLVFVLLLTLILVLRPGAYSLLLSPALLLFEEDRRLFGAPRQGQPKLTSQGRLEGGSQDLDNGS